jgi:hypothetical protein
MTEGTMKRISKSDPALSGERKVRALEAELTKVTEEFRLAKLAAKEAKGHAKDLKKEKKRVLKALIAAQAEQDERTPIGTSKEAQAEPSEKARSKRKDATRRVAASPEVVRKPRRSKKPPALTTAEIDSSVTKSSDALTEESLPSETTVNSAE